MLEIVSTLTKTLQSALDSRQDLVLENLALRHQLAVLTRCAQLQASSPHRRRVPRLLSSNSNPPQPWQGLARHPACPTASRRQDRGASPSRRTPPPLRAARRLTLPPSQLQSLRLPRAHAGGRNLLDFPATCSPPVEAVCSQQSSASKVRLRPGRPASGASSRETGFWRRTRSWLTYSRSPICPRRRVGGRMCVYLDWPPRRQTKHGRQVAARIPRVGDDAKT